MWTAPRTWTVGEMATASLLNAQIRDNLLETMAGLAQAAGDLFPSTAAATVARLALGAANRVLRVDSAGSAFEWYDHNALMPWYVSVDPAEGLTGETGTWSISAPNNLRFLASTYSSDGTQNREIYWDLLLSAGTWKFGLTHETASDNGIYDVQIDGVSVGTIDGYTAATVDDNYSEITGIAVATGGKRRLKLVMSTKHASSSNYRARLQHVAMLRTA